MQTGSDVIAVQVLNPHRIPVVLRKKLCSVDLIEEKERKEYKKIEGSSVTDW